MNMSSLSGKTSNKCYSNYEKYILSNREYWCSNYLLIEKDSYLYNRNLDKIGKILKNSKVYIKDFNLVINNCIKYVLCEYNKSLYYIRLCSIKKPSNKSIEKYERQEDFLISIIENNIKTYNKPVSIVTNCNTLNNIKGTIKNRIRNFYGKNPYTDIWLNIDDKLIGISNKGIYSPSIFGGGLTSLLDIDRKYISSIYFKALNEAKKSNEFKINSSKSRDIYIHITNKKFLKKAISGNNKMGGNNLYYYLGDMDIKYYYKDSVIYITNGNFIHIDDFIKNNEFYLRIRKRFSYQIFTDLIDYRYNIPYIFKSIEGNERSRIVGTISYPANAFTIED